MFIMLAFWARDCFFVSCQLCVPPCRSPGRLVGRLFAGSQTARRQPGDLPMKAFVSPRLGRKLQANFHAEPPFQATVGEASGSRSRPREWNSKSG